MRGEGHEDMLVQKYIAQLRQPEAVEQAVQYRIKSILHTESILHRP